MKRHKITKEDITNADDIFFSFKTLRDKDNDKPEENKPEEEMINIYHHNMPKRLERKSRKGLMIFLIGLIVLIISGGIFYYYGKKFFLGGQIFTGDNVKLEIKGLTEAAAGEEITYLIEYRNLEKIDLSDVVLTINYPTGFVYKKAKPLPSNQNNSWELGYLRPGKSGEIKIIGSLIGEDEQTEKLRAQLQYRLGNDKSRGEQEAEIETKIISSVLDLDIIGPKQLLDKEIEYTIKYANNSNSTIEDIKLIALYPADFIFVSSEPMKPQDNTENSVWLINQLTGEQNKELMIKGYFEEKNGDPTSEGAGSPASAEAAAGSHPSPEATAGEQKILKVQIGILDTQDIFYLQQEKEFITSLVSGDIAINLKLNDFAENSIINLNDTLTYEVNYLNQSDLNLQDVKLKLIINSNILDWTSLEDEARGVVADEEIINGMLARSITWKIEEIKPEAEGNFIIKIKSKPYSKLDKTKSLELKAESRVQTVIGQVDGEKVNKIIESKKLVAQVNTELKLQTQASLQNKDDYQVSWQLTNSIHEVENVKVEASLTDDSSWLADTSVSAGDIYFDPETKQVSWQLNRIPVGVDIPLVAKFKLKTSTEGRPKLLVDFNLTATDKVTGAQIAESFSEVMGE